MLKVIILALLVVQFVQSTSFEQTKNCLKGPEYWCKSVQNSRECGAFKHCLDTVWSTHHKYLRVEQADKSCDSCLECLHGDTKKCPNVDLNLDEIADLYMASIPSMTICKLVDGCKKVEEISEDNKVENRVNLDDCRKLHPRTWCDSIENARMCNSIDYCRENIWTKLKPMVLADNYKKTDGECGFCIWTFNKLHEILQQNLTEFSIEQYLIGACSLFPSKDDEARCTDAIKKNFDEVYNLVRNSMDPGIICRVIKLCKDEHMTEKKIKVSIKILNPDDVIVTSPLKPNLLGSKTEILVPKLARTGGFACELCSLVLNGARYLLQNENDEEMVLAFVSKNLCGRLGSLNSTCVEYINTEGKQIIEALVKNVDASLICHKMGLCLQEQVTSPNTKRFFDINVKNNQNCTLCKLVMTEVKTMLHNKKSEDQVLDYIRKNLCEKSTQYSDMCKTVVTAYGPLLLEFISNDINPTQICQLIGLCQKQQEDEVKANNGCALCEFVLTTLDSFIAQNSSQAEVEKWLGYVCEALPATIRDECKTFVSEYEPVIAALLANQIKPDQVCKKIGLCPKEIEAIKASTGCALCEFVLTTLDSFIAQNSSSAEVEKWLQYVCQALPATIRDECKTFVSEYEPVIVALLANQIKPDQICKTIGLCPKTDDFKIENIEAIKNAMFELKDNRPQCVICEFVLTVLSKYITQNSSQAEVEKWLEYVCTTAMPSTIKQECSAFVAQYGPVIIQLLSTQVQPQKICSIIKVCTNTVEHPIKSIHLTKTTDVDVKDKSEVYCEACELALKFIEYEIGKDKSKKKIEQTLENVCKFAPVSMRATCNSLVETYGIYLIDLLEKYAEPIAVCYRIKLCSHKAETVADVPPPVVEQPKVKDAKCQICVYVAETAQGLLKQNKTDEEIKQELEKVCNIFPGQLKDECLSFMDAYLVYVLELLADDIDPTTTCQKLNLCPALSLVVENQQTKNDRLKLPLPQQQKEESQVKDTKCQLCLYVAEIIDGLLKQNKTDEEIKVALEKVCNYFPGSLKDQCVSFMDAYLVYVLELLADDLDPQTACQKLNLCPANNQITHVDFRSLLKTFRDKVMKKRLN